MKSIKIILSSVAFVGAIGSAFATTMVNRNVFTATTAPCHLILCNTQDVEGSGIACPDLNQKFRVRTVTGVCQNPISQAFLVTQQ